MACQHESSFVWSARYLVFDGWLALPRANPPIRAILDLCVRMTLNNKKKSTHQPEGKVAREAVQGKAIHAAKNAAKWRV